MLLNKLTVFSLEVFKYWEDKFIIRNVCCRLDAMAQVCSLSYLEGRNQEDRSLGQPGQKVPETSFQPKA
jgi:hypothetical protein